MFSVVLALCFLQRIIIRYFSRKRAGQKVLDVVFTTLITRSGLNPHPGHVVASLDKTRYDDYLCVVTLKKQQIQWIRIQRNPQEH